MTEIEHILQTHGARVTKPRKQLFAVLQEAVQPLSINEITTKLVEIDRTSVYRTLDLFEQLGIVSIVHTGWKKRYELASPFKPHHHHIQCTACGKLTDLGSERLERLIEEISDAHGYLPTAHHVEISGICAACRHGTGNLA